MGIINTTLFNADNTINAEIINLTDYDILLEPFGGCAPTLLKKQRVAQVIDDAEVFYLANKGVVIPACDRICSTPLEEIVGRFYIVSEKTKKCYKNREDVLTVAYCEGFNSDGALIVRKLFL